MKSLIDIVDSTESVDRKLTNLLILVQSFQLNWQRYYFSEGHMSYQKHNNMIAVFLGVDCLKDFNILFDQLSTYLN